MAAMTPFWIGLGIYLGGWVAFVVVMALVEPGPFDGEYMGLIVPMGIMWPVWAVIGAVYVVSWAVLAVLAVIRR